jgi:hypothetical protein
MFNQLNHHDIDKLQQHLIVPLAVSDILNHNLEVEPEMQYSLHMALSEIDPDSALLAIALSACDLADQFKGSFPIAVALQKEANAIIEEYGPSWLHHYKAGPMPTDTFESILQTVPEDLEALADLMDALSADLDTNQSSTVCLINLLSIQARAHMEIAEFILAEIAYEKTEKGSGNQNPSFNSMNLEKEQGDNIILFPGNGR